MASPVSYANASSTPILYSVPISDPAQSKGETPIYRHPDAIHSLATYIKRVPQVKTLQQLHEYNAHAYPGLNCLGSRVKLPNGSLGHYEFKTFKTVNQLAKQAGSAIFNLGLAPLVHATGFPDILPIAIYSANCEQWMTLDIGCCLYGITVVPIFATLGLDSLQYIFEHTNTTTIFVSGVNLDKSLKETAEGKMAKLKNIISFHGYNEAQKKLAQQANILLLSWEEFLSHGEKLQPYPEVKPDTVFTLQYTSGTTGNPKGVVLTHANFIASFAGSEDRNGYDIEAVGKGDIHLSYLTLAHIFERFFAHLVLARGVTIGFFGGDVQKLGDDLQALKPTFMISAPRLYNKFYDNIQAMLIKTAIKEGKIVPKEGDNIVIEPTDDHIFTPSILSQLKNITGGRVKKYYSGSAPISPEVARFLKKAFSAPLMEAFGQTEIAGGAFSQRAEDETYGHIGGPFTSVEFKLVDVHEMNYTSKDIGSDGVPMPRGELCLRGAQIFKGYYKEPEKTAETIDAEGWHHTGDIATILPNGAVKIIDRRKNIFKLAQGEYIAPEKIENVYLTNKYVAEVFVYGDIFKSYTVAIVVPDTNNLMELGKELGLGGKTFEELCQDEKVKARVLQDIRQTGRAAKLAGYELAHKIHLEPKSLTVYGLMTFSMKLKRNMAKVHFEEVIKSLYQKTGTLTDSKL